MNIKLKEIKILEPNIKVEIPFRAINVDIPNEQIIGTAGYATLIVNGISGIVGNATEINE